MLLLEGRQINGAVQENSGHACVLDASVCLGNVGLESLRAYIHTRARVHAIQD
jgi:hypothetical protein